MKTIHDLRQAAQTCYSDVCQIHYDRSVMNADGTCSECQDDLHEFEIINATKEATK